MKEFNEVFLHVNIFYMKKIYFVFVFLLVGAGCISGSDGSPSDKMLSCKQDSDCVYADNSVCPYASKANVIAINEKYRDDYLAQTEREEGQTCLTSTIMLVGNPECVQKVCTLPEEF